MQNQAVVAGMEFSLSEAEVVPRYGPTARGPGAVEENPVLQFTNSDARLSAQFYITQYELEDPPSLGDPWVWGCLDGGVVSMNVSSIADFPMSRIEREFLAEAGPLSLAYVTLAVDGRSGLTSDVPQYMFVSIAWDPEPFVRAEFDYSAAKGSDYAATVPTTMQFRTLISDLYRSLAAAAADGSGCEPETEMTEEQLLGHFDELLAEIAGTAAPLMETIGLPVGASPNDVDATAGFVIVDQDGEWERSAESVRVSSDRSLAGVDGDGVAELERRLMSITEDGRELVTDDDWAAAETTAYTANYVAVAVEGDDLLITVDTKGVMSPEMRESMISVISQVTAAAGSDAIRIADSG